MTLVLTVNGPETLWMVADRRLSYDGRPRSDFARKVMVLETPDGTAILGYAGLGATAVGTQPADWMSAVLRGINAPLERCLGIIADAMKRQFPRHLLQMPGDGGPAHNIVIPAFVAEEPRLYTIDLVFAPDRKSYSFRYTRHIADRAPPAAPRTQRFAATGSGDNRHGSRGDTESELNGGTS